MMFNFLCGCPFLVPRKHWRQVILSACFRCWCSYSECVTILTWWHQERTPAPTSAPLFSTAFHHWCWVPFRRKTKRFTEFVVFGWKLLGWVDTILKCSTLSKLSDVFCFVFLAYKHIHIWSDQQWERTDPVSDRCGGSQTKGHSAAHRGDLLCSRSTSTTQTVSNKTHEVSKGKVTCDIMIDGGALKMMPNPFSPWKIAPAGAIWDQARRTPGCYYKHSWSRSSSNLSLHNHLSLDHEPLRPDPGQDCGNDYSSYSR